MVMYVNFIAMLWVIVFSVLILFPVLVRSSVVNLNKMENASYIIQDSDACLPVLVRSCPRIPCRWLSVCHQRSSKTTAFRWHEETDCPPNLQLLRGQDLCSCGRKSVEQFAGRSTNGRVVILPIQADAEDVFVWTLWPRRIVNFSFLRRVEIFVLTYLYLLKATVCNQSQCNRNRHALP